MRQVRIANKNDRRYWLIKDNSYYVAPSYQPLLWAHKAHASISILTATTTCRPHFKTPLKLRMRFQSNACQNLIAGFVGRRDDTWKLIIAEFYIMTLKKILI